MSDTAPIWDIGEIEDEPPHSEADQRGICAALARYEAATGTQERYEALGHVLESVAAAKGFTPLDFVARLLPLRWGRMEE